MVKLIQINNIHLSASCFETTDSTLTHFEDGTAKFRLSFNKFEADTGSYQFICMLRRRTYELINKQVGNSQSCDYPSLLSFRH